MTLGTGHVEFRAYGVGDVLLGSVGPVTLGDGAVTGETAEDRFFGVYNAAGISAIELSMPNSTDWEADHLQYGFAAIPEPSSIILVASAGAFLAVRRRRR